MAGREDTTLLLPLYRKRATPAVLRPHMDSLSLASQEATALKRDRPMQELKQEEGKACSQDCLVIPTDPPGASANR